MQGRCCRIRPFPACYTNVGLFATMNATKEMYEKMYQSAYEDYANEFYFLNGEISLYPVCNTLQVSDYAQFSMGGFNEDAKKQAQEECFPADCKNAYAIGAKLSR